MIDEKPDRDLEALLEYLKNRRGFDFTGYKRGTLTRRINRRMQVAGVERYSDYQDYLEVHNAEFAHLFDSILINVTAFLRDPPAWEYLVHEVVPRILAGKANGEPVRVWSAGCASGEEPYSLSMVLAEAMGQEAFRQRAKIYATDIDEAALAHARQASYGAKDIEAVPAELRERYFETVGNRYVFRGDLRRTVIFGRNDLTQDAPISQLDLLSCRNTMMYFNAETQARVVRRFHFALKNSGFLFLGRAEMLLTHTNLFTPADLQYRVFTKTPGSEAREPAMPPLAREEGMGVQAARLRDTSFDAAPVALLVVDADQALAVANLEARSLFGVYPRDFGRPFRDLDVSYRPVELRSIIDEVMLSRRAASRSEVPWAVPGSEARYFDLLVTPLLDNGRGLLGVAVSFIDVTRSRVLRAELERSKQELESAYEELQSTNEEMETTNEELQSTNEELETTNEELQSTNEELETMNEELQSTNEELQTLNDELHQRTEEGQDITAFLQSVLGGMHDAVIVLDRNLLVTSWNDRAADLWGLRPEEVLGGHFLNLDIGLPVAQLKGRLRAVLAGETGLEEEALEATSRRGKAIKCNITYTARKGSAGAVVGVILLMREA
jgi:two-component system CheB/CheR fusion protein